MKKELWFKVCNYSDSLREVMVFSNADPYGHYQWFKTRSEAVHFMFGRADKRVADAEKSLANARAKVKALAKKYPTT